MNLSELASKLDCWQTVHLNSLNVDIRVKRLNLKEVSEVERLVEVCSTGSGKNRSVTNIAKLVHTIVKKYFTDAEGNQLAADDTEEQVSEWPGTLVQELLAAYRTVNEVQESSDSP